VVDAIEVSGQAGRVLEVELYGPPDGPAVIFQTGTPSAGKLFASMVEAGARLGVRHVAYSRPGYGRSGRAEGRSVADCVEDVAAVADRLGIERFYTVGWSGGGPHALASAALLPERVIAAATLASPAPRNAERLDWLIGMAAENVEEFGAADAGEEQLRAHLDRHAPELAHATGPDLHAALGDLISEVDGRVLTGEFAEYLASSTRAGLEHGIWGWVDDDLAFVGDWGFDLGAISVPVAIWHGGEDRFVPYAHGGWLAEHIANATPHLYPHHGHLSLAVGSYDVVLDDLIAHRAN
jgi:pimeloyl-ACP methyl ester carboxylesterase